MDAIQRFAEENVKVLRLKASEIDREKSGFVRVVSDCQYRKGRVGRIFRGAFNLSRVESPI